MLVIMELAEFKDAEFPMFDHAPDWWHFQPLRELREVEPILPDTKGIYAGPSIGWLDPMTDPVSPQDLDGEVFISTVHSIDDEEKMTGVDADYMFMRYRSVPQGLGMMMDDGSPAPPTIEEVVAFVKAGSALTFQTQRHFFSYESGVWKLNVFDDPPMQDGFLVMRSAEFIDDPMFPDASSLNAFFDHSVKWALARQFVQRYQWRVLFRDWPRGTASLALVTDPIGAAAAFRLRDRPKGKTRRTALKHWVSEHWRQDRGGDTASLVRAFLRGETKFTFEGMECTIVPSQYDIDKNEEFIELRKRLAREGKTRRSLRTDGAP